MTAGWRVQRRGDLTLDWAIAALAGGQARHLVQQSLGVGMQRTREQCLGRRGFDHAPEVHDDNAVCDVFDHAKVVADEQVSEAQLFAQVHEQVQHLRLDGHVERADGFIGDDQFGVHGQGTGDGDTLALTTRELVRVAGAEGRIEANLFQQVSGESIGIAPGNLAVDPRRFGQDAVDPVARVQRRHRVLKHHLHPQACLAAVGGGLAAPVDLARRGGMNARGDAPERGLAAPRFPHQPDHFARRD
jgi:hypothetical protein